MYRIPVGKMSSLGTATAVLSLFIPSWPESLFPNINSCLFTVSKAPWLLPRETVLMPTDDNGHFNTSGLADVNPSHVYTRPSSSASCSSRLQIVHIQRNTHIHTLHLSTLWLHITIPHCTCRDLFLSYRTDFTDSWIMWCFYSAAGCVCMVC